MSFTKKFKKGDKVRTNQKWAECVGKHYDYVRVSQGSTKCGVVVNEYESERPLADDNWCIISNKGGGVLHLVDFVDSNGIKHTLNVNHLELLV